MGSAMNLYKKLVLPLLILGLGTLPASAAVPELAPLNVKTRYDVTIGGMAIGRVRITVTEDAFGYRMIVDTKTRGLVDIFAPLESIAIAKGRVTDAREYIPQSYSSVAKKDGDNKNRRASITYDAAGQIVTRSRLPDEKGWRPVVPLEKANEAVDPMTGFLVLRHALRDAMAREQREATVLTYDAGRLARLTVKVISRARIEVDGKYRDAINTVVTRQPIDGYTPKEMKKFKEGDPVMHIYFSPDAEFMPLLATIRLHYGDIRVTLTEKSKP